MDRSQAEDLLANEDENSKAAIKFNKEKLQPWEEEILRISGWAELLAQRTHDKEKVFLAIQSGDMLLNGKYSFKNYCG